MNKVKLLEETKAALAKYPRPFHVGRFVDKFEIYDGNGSEISIYARKQIENALNLIGDCSLSEASSSQPLEPGVRG